MNKKWLEVAGELLKQASDEFSNHGCNDWDFPKSWTKEEKHEFVKAMYKDNGTYETDYDPGDPHVLSVDDWWVMSFLASILKKEGKQ